MLVVVLNDWVTLTPCQAVDLVDYNNINLAGDYILQELLEAGPLH
jgi:hypothetical protein